MSGDRIRVVVEGDASDLRQALRSAAAELRAFGSQTQAQSRRVLALNAAHQKQIQTLQGVDRAARLAAAGLGVMAGVGMGAAIKKGIQLNAQWESLNASLATFLGNRREAATFMEDLRSVSQESPFRLTQWADQARQLLGFGVAAEKVIPLLDAVNMAIVTTGGNEDKMQRVVLALGQMQAKGKASAEEINQLAEAGVPVNEILAKALRMTGEEVQNIGDKGVAANRAISAIAQGWQGAYGGAYENAKKTFDMQVAVSKKTGEQLLRLSSEPLFKRLERREIPALNDFLKGATNIFNSHELKWGEKFTLSMNLARKELGPIWDEIADDVERMDLPEKFGDMLSDAIPVVAEGAGELGFEIAEGIAGAFVEADPLGKAIIAGYFLSKLGAFEAAGKASGKRYGKGFALGVALGLPLALPEIGKALEDVQDKLNDKLPGPIKWLNELGGDLLGGSFRGGGMVVPGDPRMDGTPILAAGGETIFTWTGQDIINQVGAAAGVPNLVDFALDAQLPHFNTGGQVGAHASRRFQSPDAQDRARGIAPGDETPEKKEKSKRGGSYRKPPKPDFESPQADAPWSGRYSSTAYGPPWGGINGQGITATGVDLRGNPRKYIVAVDPKVIPLHSKLKISPNPFGDKDLTFAAEDTGGAIKGKRIDFYDWRGRAAQMAWGRRMVDVGGPSKDGDETESHKITFLGKRPSISNRLSFPELSRITKPLISDALSQGIQFGLSGGQRGEFRDRVIEAARVALPSRQRHTVSIEGSTGTGSNVGLAGGSKAPKGLATFDGKPLAKWIKPHLEWARKNGWGGGLTEGFRPYAVQKRYYDEMLAGKRAGPVAKPGQSNHQGTSYPRGAADVSNPEQLAGMVKRSPISPPLKWYGPGDRWHFSATGMRRGGRIPGFRAGGSVSPILNRINTGGRGPQFNAPAGRGLKELDGALEALTFEGVRNVAERIRGMIVDLRRGGLDGAERNKVNRLRGALSLTEFETGARIGKQVLGANLGRERLADRIAERSREMRMLGIDPNSADGLDRQQGLERLTAGKLGGVRDQLAQALRRARNAGAEREDIDGILNQLKEVDTEIKEAVVKRMELLREKVKARAQEGVDVATHGGAMADLALGALTANQRLAGKGGTAEALREQAKTISSTSVPALQGVWASLKQQLAVTTDPAGRRTIVEQMAQTMSSAADKLADAGDLLREAATLDKQKVIDGADRTIGMAGAGLRQLRAKMKLSDVGDAESLRAQAAFITANVVPGIGQKIAAMQGLRDLYASRGDTDGASQTEVDIQSLLADQLEAQVDAKDLLSEIAKSVEQTAKELNELLKAENLDLKKNLALSQAQYGVFGGLPSAEFLGGFAHGAARVPRTGVALLHRDEMVVPDPAGPYGNSTSQGGGAAPQVTLVLQGDAGNLVQLVDARINGRTAEVANRDLGRAARVLMVAPGR